MVPGNVAGEMSFLEIERPKRHHPALQNNLSGEGKQKCVHLYLP